jgi:hypothetical protein
VEVIVLAVALAGSIGLALGLGRLVLGTILDLMVGRPVLAGVTVQWRRVAFVAGLFWLWYLVPAIAAAATKSSAAVIIRHLLGE